MHFQLRPLSIPTALLISIFDEIHGSIDWSERNWTPSRHSIRDTEAEHSSLLLVRMCKDCWTRPPMTVSRGHNSPSTNPVTKAKTCTHRWIDNPSVPIRSRMQHVSTKKYYRPSCHACCSQKRTFLQPCLTLPAPAARSVLVVTVVLEWTSLQGIDGGV